MLYYKNKIVNSIIKGNKILRKIAKSLYIIPLEKFGIYNDDTNPTSTTEGINSALLYAKSKGYKRVKLPSGTYSIDTAVVNEIELLLDKVPLAITVVESEFLTKQPVLPLLQFNV